MSDIVYEIANYFNSMNTFIKNNSHVFGLITFFLGFFLGNYFSLWRDRRREFNAIVEPIRNKFIKFKDRATYIDIPEHSIIDIRNGLSILNRKGFSRAIKQYKKATSQQENMKSDGMGGFTYIDESIIIHASKDLLKYLKKK